MSGSFRKNFEKKLKEAEKYWYENAYDVEWTEQGTPIHYYANGKVVLNYNIEMKIELPKKLAKKLIMVRNKK